MAKKVYVKPQICEYRIEIMSPIVSSPGEQIKGHIENDDTEISSGGTTDNPSPGVWYPKGPWEAE